MSKINVQIDIPESMDNFLKLLPLNIRKNYVSQMTSAIIKENEKQIIDNVTKIVQEMMQVLISEKDESILQEELDKYLSESGIIIDSSKKTVKGKKKGSETLKKPNVETEEIQSTVLTGEVKNQVEFLKSDEQKQLEKDQVVTSSSLESGINQVDVTQNNDNTTYKEVKKLDLESMFNK